MKNLIELIETLSAKVSLLEIKKTFLKMEICSLRLDESLHLDDFDQKTEELIDSILNIDSWEEFYEVFLTYNSPATSKDILERWIEDLS